MPAPPRLIELVARFREQLEEYKRGQYNETQLRRDFLDPLFTLLGWDVDNRAGYAESFREVVHEDAVKVGGTTKAPDYSFRIGGRRLFFLEAKKPSVSIKQDIAPAYQLRRYAWSAGLQLSILSDFEEFAVYDGALKPDPKDKSSRSRVFYCSFEDYAEKWDEIAALFSKEAVLKGGIERFVKKLPGRRGTATVDAEFLAQIESWRELLARNIALRNDGLDVHALNHAVQATIDRIVFLRICEDRGIEDEGRLLALVNGPGIYARLVNLLRDADDRYNSGLFHFASSHSSPSGRGAGGDGSRSGHPDTFTLGLTVDDKPLKDIIRALYYPESPYEFSVLPPDILGQVYERFLGKVIRLTAGGQAKVEEKPEVKKAGGVYYTPTYIVDYIVRQTVGRLLEGKTPKQAEKLRICDPACGSGSFLMGAYQYLLDWHLKWYVEDEPEKYARGKSPKLRQSHDGWRLAVAERKRILLNNIYGVDIDAQAVEVTKLSLLLKVLEGETSETLGLAQLKLFHQRALPDLDANILCGNSLIGSDFYDGRLDLDEEERRRVNAFDWESGFPEVFMAGGFDVVIGNPPYIFTRELLSQKERSYFASTYRLGWEKQNTYLVFMERMLSLLSKNGSGAYIVPNSWLTIESAKLLRAEFVKHLSIVLDLNYAVFRGVSMEPCVFIIDTKSNAQTVACARCSTADQFAEARFIQLERVAWMVPDSRITFGIHESLHALLSRIKEQCPTLGEQFDVRTGLQAYETGKGTPRQSKSDVSNHIFDCTSKEDKTCVQYLEGSDIGRYFQVWCGMWMKYGPWLAQPRELAIFFRPRILIREITSLPPYCINATVVEDTFLNNKSILNVLEPHNNIERLKVLCAVLNSRLMSECYKAFAVKAARKLFPKIVIKNLREFPIPAKLGERSDARAAEFKKIGALVDMRMHIQEKVATAKTNHQKTLIQRQIEATDRQIDALVYELYDLTEDEIRIVEGSGA